MRLAKEYQARKRERSRAPCVFQPSEWTPENETVGSQKPETLLDSFFTRRQPTDQERRNRVVQIEQLVHYLFPVRLGMHAMPTKMSTPASRYT